MSLLHHPSDRVESLLDELGIPRDLIARRGLPVCLEPAELAVVEIGADGREYRLIPPAVHAWQRLRAAALADGVILRIESAYRDLERQADIIRRKLARSVPLEIILCASAPPGYSEHHLGRAVDVSTPGSTPLDPEFEQTLAFDWLTLHAGRFGYALSFPRDNRWGYNYEPWHWCFHGSG